MNFILIRFVNDLYLAIMKKKSLAETHPEIAKQWHPAKNGSLTPYDFTKGSHKKVWWKCDKGGDHEWTATVNNRAGGSNCPICRGLKVVNSNCLATINPLISKEWHPSKNGDLTPNDVTLGSGKKVWWKCDKADDHEWYAQIASRIKGRNCPMCSGNIVVRSNSLGSTHPELTKEWHKEKNRKVTPFDVRYGSNRKVWWMCDVADDHIYEMEITSKATQKQGCPMCSGNRVVKSNCLASTHPDISKQWHPTLNGDLTPNDFVRGSNKKVWWKCDVENDHIWIASIKNRSKFNQGCGVCSGRVVVPSTSLKNNYPNISKQWHPTKNKSFSPEKIYKGTNKSFWWKCNVADDHIWKSRVADRIDGHNCPMCSGNIVVRSNSLGSTHPELTKEWHKEKNRKVTPFDVSYGSGRKVWWQCSKDNNHEWQAQISNRIVTGCPYCDLTPQSKQELTITFELIKLFKNIDPKGLKTRLEGRLRAIDIYIPKLNLCIEFDGSYWHKDKRDIDKIKSEMLFEEGFKLIRVREEPLEKIYDTDVISKKPYNGKQVTNDILSMILSIFELDPKLVSKIKDYQSKDGLQNEKGLEKYIDKILTEKAEKNG
jgi:hypothetical protein